MLKKDLHPPHSGPSANPVLYGIAAGLAQLFPPVDAQQHGAGGQDSARDGHDEDGQGEGE